MIHTATHYLDTSDIHWDVSFVFQDIIEDDIANNLRNNGINPELAGWIGCTSFKKAIFVNFGFYNKTSLELTEEYLNDLPKNFCDKQIMRGLSILQASSKSRVTVNDFKALSKQIKTLASRKWNTNITAKNNTINKIITKKRDAKMFRDITIAVSASKLTKNEQQLMLRFRTILTDIINYNLFEITGIYNNGVSDVVCIDGSDNLGFILRYTITRKMTTVNKLEQLIHNCIKSFDISKNMSAIDDHFKAFASQPDWQDMPINYYDKTQIITTNMRIAKQATLNNIKSLIGKLTFTVRDSTKEDDDLI